MKQQQTHEKRETIRAEAQPARRTTELLGRKGIETRLRLMNAARELLLSTSPVSLAVAAIARAAKTSPATFYVYFNDVMDVVLALAAESSDDLDAVLETLDRWQDGLPARKGAAAFITAYRAYYAKHRPIFAIRNMEADRGDARFLDIRVAAGEKILMRLAGLMARGHRATGDAVMDERNRVARAAVIYAAVERLAASENLYAGHRRTVSSEYIVEAQIAMLAELVAGQDCL